MPTQDREDTVEVDDDLTDTLEGRAEDILEGDFVTPEEHEKRRSD